MFFVGGNFGIDVWMCFFCIVINGNNGVISKLDKMYFMFFIFLGKI